MANICVFSSSSNGVAECYQQAAAELGRLIGQYGHDLVYGGSNLGLMGKVARSVQANGGKAIGILPKIFEKVAEGEDELVTAEDLRHRKSIMELRSQGFIALPGGIGTLDEIADVITSRYLKIHNKPVAIINTNNFFEHFLAHIEKVQREKFGKGISSLFYVADTPQGAIDYINPYLGN
jgi:uncharacterized protein (TIGR00730 family)